jgi:hypothetical protein
MKCSNSKISERNVSRTYSFFPSFSIQEFDCYPTFTSMRYLTTYLVQRIEMSLVFRSFSLIENPRCTE